MKKEKLFLVVLFALLLPLGGLGGQAWADKTVTTESELYDAVKVNQMVTLGADNKLYYPTTAMTIGSCRAYFALNGITAGDHASGINHFSLNFGEATGIEESTTLCRRHADSTGWHTLDGRKLIGAPTAKGIYINNGKKVIVK